MKKGERVQHITGVNFGDIRDGQLYVTAEEYDNHLYEAFLSSNLLSKGWNPSKVSIELKQDLIAPSSNQQRDVFNQFREVKEKMLQNDLNLWNQKKGRESVDINEMNDDKVYDVFMNSLEMTSSSQKNFYGMLKRLGFNAVLDEHDVTGSWMQGKKPLIIMDALSTLGDVKIEELTVPKMQEAFEKWFEMNKTN